MHADSVDKIVTRYIATVSRQSFEYKGKTYEPKPLRVSSLLLRDYTCPHGCGGCCHIKFSLDYLPAEFKRHLAQADAKHLRNFEVEVRWVEVNGTRFKIFTDWQHANEERHCEHLNMKDGRCGIYTCRPFSCDFELIRTLQYENSPNVLTQKLFGRGWNMKRIDGERGALCEMTEITEHSIAEVVRKLHRLKEWADYFRIDTWATTIIDLIKDGALMRKGSILLHPGYKPPRKGLAY